MRPTQRPSTIRLLSALGGLLLVVAACSSSGASASAPAAQPSAAASAAGSAAAGGEEYVIAAATDAKLGGFLTGEDGKTLYIFTPDSANTSTCVDACATELAAARRRLDRHAQGRRRRHRQAHDLRATGRHDAGRLQRHPAVLLRQGREGRRHDRPGRRWQVVRRLPDRPAAVGQRRSQRLLIPSATQKTALADARAVSIRGPRDQPPGVSQTGYSRTSSGLPSLADGL